MKVALLKRSGTRAVLRNGAWGGEGGGPGAGGGRGGGKLIISMHVIDLDSDLIEDKPRVRTSWFLIAFKRHFLRQV